MKPYLRLHFNIISAIFLFLELMFLPVSAIGKTDDAESNSNDSLKASLLTCSPGQNIYEYYGHTALRIQNFTKNEDYVFNYGLFSFNTPGFVWRFIKGDCQYEVGATYTAEFLAYYAEQGRGVREMVLNLSQGETHRLFKALIANCEPENRTYQYNFFYNNCATKVRDQIEACLDSNIIYTLPVKTQSLRDIVHEYCKGHPWSRFSQDLLLGAEADKSASREAQEFAPFYLEQDISTARTCINGQMEALVSSSNELVTEHPAIQKTGFPLTPKTCAIILCLLTICICIWEHRHPGRILWGYDLILLIGQGLTGCIIAFLFFFSAHPTVNSNWLILLFNPLPLLFLFYIIKAERNCTKSWYHTIAFWWVLLFIMAIPFIPQKIDIETILLAFCLLTRSGNYLAISSSTYKKKRKKQQSHSIG